jgi:hypothetical protein
MRKILSILFLSLVVSFSTKLKAQIHQTTVDYGGIYNDEGTASVVDAQKNTYLVGNYVDSIDLDPSINNAGHTTTNAPNAFIAKYNATRYNLYRLKE